MPDSDSSGTIMEQAKNYRCDECRRISIFYTTTSGFEAWDAANCKVSSYLVVITEAFLILLQAE